MTEGTPVSEFLTTHLAIKGVEYTFGRREDLMTADRCRILLVDAGLWDRADAGDGMRLLAAEAQFIWARSLFALGQEYGIAAVNEAAFHVGHRAYVNAKGSEDLAERTRNFQGDKFPSGCPIPDFKEAEAQFMEGLKDGQALAVILGAWGLVAEGYPKRAFGHFEALEKYATAESTSAETMTKLAELGSVIHLRLADQLDAEAEKHRQKASELSRQVEAS